MRDARAVINKVVEVQKAGDSLSYLVGGILTLLDSHACGGIELVVLCNAENSRPGPGGGCTYQALEDAFARCCAAGLHFPDVVFCDFLELEFV